jgi:hypothetical protein
MKVSRLPWKVPACVGGRGKRAPAAIDVGLTAQTLSCTARAHVPKPTRRAACLHVRRAMQAA